MDKLIVRGTEVSIQWNMERDDYISLTDIAKVKDSDNPRYIIQNWMQSRMKSSAVKRMNLGMYIVFL